jgi:hypothetical protein
MGVDITAALRLSASGGRVLLERLEQMLESLNELLEAAGLD